VRSWPSGSRESGQDFCAAPPVGCVNYRHVLMVRGRLPAEFPLGGLRVAPWARHRDLARPGFISGALFGLTPRYRRKAGLAQLVEHLICNQGVGGSNPSAGTNKINRLSEFSETARYIGNVINNSVTVGNAITTAVRWNRPFPPHSWPMKGVRREPVWGAVRSANRAMAQDMRAA
jgi:hypothetical protein